jgi:hypothetical protein
MKVWNDDPKPFVWHKTADQILERLAGYCTAINPPIRAHRRIVQSFGVVASV